MKVELINKNVQQEDTYGIPCFVSTKPRMTEQLELGLCWLHVIFSNEDLLH